jgi:hypothetical protein
MPAVAPIPKYIRPCERTSSGEVVTEVLEPVKLPRRREKEVTGLERTPLSSVEELATAAHHNIDLVAAVWRLRVDAARSVELQLKRAVAEHLGGTLAGRAGQPAQCGRELEMRGDRSETIDPASVLSLVEDSELRDDSTLRSGWQANC